MKNKIWVVALLLLVLLLPNLIFFIGHAITTSVTESPYIRDNLSVDEAFILTPAMTVYENGYFGFRCREGHSGACYGGTQVYLDALLLKLAPQDWLKNKATSQGSSQAWPWLVKYPNALELLRISRLFHALFILIFFFCMSYWATREISFALFFSLVLGANPIFTYWSGAKNDFASITWLILFLSMFFLFLQKKKSADIYWLLAIAIGVLGVSVRPSLVPFVLSGFGIYFVLTCFEWKTTKKIPYFNFIIGLSAVIGALVLHLLVNPNVFVSSSEANSILTFFMMKRKSADLNALKIEAIIFIQAIATTIIVAFFWKPFSKTISSTTGSLGVLFGFVAPILLAVIQFSSAYNRAYYYLPILVSILFSFLYYLKHLSKEDQAKVIKYFFITAILLICLSKPWDYFFKLQELHFDRLTEIEQTIVDIKEKINGDKNLKVYVDLALRAPITEKMVATGQVYFFDSLSESPKELLAKVKSNSLFLLTCWSGKNNFILSYDSSFTRAWAEVSKEYCKETEVVSEAYFNSFSQFARPQKFTLISLEELKKKKIKTLTYNSQWIHPRIFRGAVEHLDNYEMPILIKNKAHLETDLLLPSNVKKLIIHANSSCKKNEDNFLEIKFPEQKVISLNTSIQFCRDYPKLCNYNYFQKWSERRYPIDPIILRVTPGLNKIDFNVNVSNCLFVIKNIELIN